MNACAAEVEETKLGVVGIHRGILGGLVALLTPCVFPMIPLTVVFHQTLPRPRHGPAQCAVVQAPASCSLYVGIGILLTSIFGPSILNR
ncbi:MAG: hypothetical protein IPM98_10245 [Lewinellaceae bacterium]|nr:hypothetical protein [Lewinellaceae bacterium]